MKFWFSTARLLGVLCWLLAALFAVPGRAQVTETPETVAPGHFLLRMNALSLATNIHDSAGGTSSGVALATTFITTGLTDSLDVQVGADVFVSQKYERGAFANRSSGFGDLYLRTKWTFWREGPAAAALMPYVRLPTDTGAPGKHAVQGGIIVPWALALPSGGEFRAMGRVDLLRNAAGDGYGTFWSASAAFTQPLTGLFKVYAEGTVGKSTNGLAGPGTPWAGTIGGGLQVHLATLYWWDFAVYRGFSHGAPDWNPVVRVNWGF